MKILFRVDAKPEIGIGHLQRCLSLARAFVLQKCNVVFLINDDLRANERVAQFGFKVHNIESNLALNEELQATLTFLRHKKFQIVVADSYEFGEDYLLALRQAGYCVAFIDDLARMSFPCHFVINGTVYAEELDYRSSTGDTKFLLGPKYMLLREEFWNIPERTINPEVEKILVTVGGSDPQNVTPTILDTLSAINGDFDVDVIIGPFFDNIPDINAAAMRLGNERVQLFRSPTSVRDLMLASDLAISGGGQTLYELAATGTPTVAIRLAENQEKNIAYMRRMGIIKRLDFDSGFRECADQTLRCLLQNAYLRRKMSTIGKKKVDGLGAQRVANAITQGLNTGNLRYENDLLTSGPPRRQLDS